MWSVTHLARGFRVAGRWRTEAGHLTPRSILCVPGMWGWVPSRLWRRAPHSPSPGPSLVIALAVAPGSSQHVPSSLGAWRELKSWVGTARWLLWGHNNNNRGNSRVSCSSYQIQCWVCNVISFSIGAKFTSWKIPHFTQWHLVHSQYCATITTIQFQKVFVTL